MDAIREQITRLEAYVGDSLDGDTTLSARVAETVEELGVQRGLAENMGQICRDDGIPCNND